MFLSLLFRANQLRHREEEHEQEHGVFEITRRGVGQEIQKEHLNEFVRRDVFEDRRLFNQARGSIQTIEHDQETEHERRVDDFIVSHRKVVDALVSEQTDDRQNQEKAHEDRVTEQRHL